MISTTYPYHVYIVKCADGSFYTGITTDLERRLLQHNGKMAGGAKYTQNRRPVELVYIEKFETRKEACKREWQIKHTLTHSQKMELINNSSKDELLKAV